MLRLDREYRAAWAEHAARPAYEEGTPFPVRIRSGADRIAERDWSLLAFEDPDGEAVSAFFDTPMLRIPEQSDHSFHGKVITDSIAK